MHKQYIEFDDELKKNDFLKRHYECLPFIGENYADRGLLLIGESHYIPKNEVQCVNREDFYETPFDKLADGEYKGWINTRSVFEYRAYNKAEFKNFFSNPATEIAKVIGHTDIPTFEQKIDAMQQYAFINYFKRPSYNAGGTIEGLTEKDKQYAYDITSYIIDVLKPSLIIFMSKKAYYAFCEADNTGKKILSQYSVKAVSHPSSRWWYRKRKDGSCAKEDFYAYISDIFK